MSGPLRITLGANMIVHHPGPHRQDLCGMARWKSTGGMVRKTVRLWRWDPEADTLTLPRGLWPLPERFGPFEVEDRRLLLPPVSFRWRGPDLEPHQIPAVRRMARRGKGRLVAPGGTGKTIMALRTLSLWRQPALWIVDSDSLVQQAMDAARRVYRLPPAGFGFIRDGGFHPGTHFTAGTRQTLMLLPREQLRGRWGAVWVDECDGSAARKCVGVLARLDARYKAGATATP